jgi:hypothetical protein
MKETTSASLIEANFDTAHTVIWLRQLLTNITRILKGRASPLWYFRMELDVMASLLPRPLVPGLECRTMSRPFKVMFGFSFGIVYLVELKIAKHETSIQGVWNETP